MLLNSLDFLVFFTAVTSLYFLIPYRFRWLLLLIASCYFYMAFVPKYILVLFFLIILDFCLGIKIEKTAIPQVRRNWLLVSIFANIGTLFIFKYFNFFNENLTRVFHYFNFTYSIDNLSWLLPLGLSFHTFQSLAYVIDVYHGKTPAGRHLGIYALYVMFFPQLVAGPIERPSHMLPQFGEHHDFSWPRLLSGLQRMMWGFFKKIVIADRLAVFVNSAYQNPADFSGPALTLATVFFAFQIYCDFSGYCDIAIGAARVLGFRLSENFDIPYFSSSISEFWRRWHMSLSSWFREYVYFPLGGSRVSESKIIRNLLLTFLLSGLWHGASWTFVAWGLINGTYLIVGRLKEKLLPSVRDANRWFNYRVIITFALTCFAWIFFRAKTLSEAWQVVTNLGTGWIELFSNTQNTDFIQHTIFLGQVDSDFYTAMFGIAFLLVAENIRRRGFFQTKLFSSVIFRTMVYAFLLFLVVALWEGGGSEFIYFQF